MPLYEYRCEGCGGRTEQYRPIPERDAAAYCSCEDGRNVLRRVLSVPQAPIIRPLGYSLQPGDKGYWQFETAEGRRAPRSLEPFAKRRELEASPPQLAPDDLPVALVADAPRSPGPASPDVRIKE